MAFEGLYALPASCLVSQCGPMITKVPHLDSLIQATTDELCPIRRECDRIHAILVTFNAIQTLREITSASVPHSHTLIQRSCRDKGTIRGHGHCSHPIFDLECQNFFTCINVPDSDRMIPTARCDELAVTSEIKRIDVLFMTGEGVLDCLCGNVPDLIATVSSLVRGESELAGRLTRICLSSAPVARYFPSGLKQTLRIYRSPSLSTVSSCRHCTCRPLETSKICAERLQPVATYLPS